MGSWNKTCGLSNLHIRAGDPVYVFVLEKDSEKAWNVNALGQKNVATIAAEQNARSVFISSDYVFSGEKGSPYLPSDPVSPVNAYGHSKAGGELSSLSVSDRNIVMRISSVFGSAGSSGKGGNFVETIINKAKSSFLFPITKYGHWFIIHMLIHPYA